MNTMIAVWTVLMVVLGVADGITNGPTWRLVFCGFVAGAGITSLLYGWLLRKAYENADFWRGRHVGILIVGQPPCKPLSSPDAGSSGPMSPPSSESTD